MTALKIILGLLVSFLWSGWSLAEEFLDLVLLGRLRIQSATIQIGYLTLSDQ